MTKLENTSTWPRPPGEGGTMILTIVSQGQGRTGDLLSIDNITHNAAQYNNATLSKSQVSFCNFRIKEEWGFSHNSCVFETRCVWLWQTFCLQITHNESDLSNDLDDYLSAYRRIRRLIILNLLWHTMKEGQKFSIS